MAIKGLSKLGKLGGAGRVKQATSAVRAPSAMRTGAPPIAIDLGVRALKILQVTASDPHGLIAAAMLDVPEDLHTNPAKRLKFQLDALPKLIKQGGFKSNRAVCSIPAGQMFCKHLQLARTEGVDRTQVARAAIARQIGCDPASLVCRLVDAKDLGGGRAEVVCYAASHDLVTHIMQAVKSAKLEPVGIHAELFALVEACASEDDPTSLYLDIGRGTTKVVVAKGTHVQFARVVEFGGMHFDESVAQQLKCTMGRAQEKRLALQAVTPDAAPAEADATPTEDSGEDATGQTPDEAAVDPLVREHLRPIAPDIDLTEPLEILTDEVSMCLRYHRSLYPDEPVSRVVFVGGESRHRPVCEHVAKVLRLSAEIADPMARVARTGKEPTTGVHINEPQPGWAVALGMCLSPTDL